MPAVSISTIFLADEQVEQVFERGAVVRGVHRHAEDAAVGAQLLVGADAVGVERDQAEVARRRAGWRRRRRSWRWWWSCRRRWRRSARTRRPGLRAPMLGFAGAQVALQHARRPRRSRRRRRRSGRRRACGSAPARSRSRAASASGAPGAGWRCSFSMKASAPKRSSIRPFIERSSAIMPAWSRARRRRRGRPARGSRPARRRGPAQRSACAGRAAAAARRSSRGSEAGVGMRVRGRGGGVELGRRGERCSAARSGAGVDGCGARGRRAAPDGLALQRGLAALQHALAHVVLERQRAHRQPLDVLLDGRRAELGSARRRRRGCRASPPRRRAGRRAALAGSCSTWRMPSGAIASTSTPSAQRLGREHDGVVAEGLRGPGARASREVRR